MAITLTESAARQILNSISSRGKGLGLRVGVKKVGCSGLAYTFDFADELGSEDVLFESNAAKVVVAKEHLQYLDGSTLDYARDGLRQFFRFDNPNVKASCGCGESFSVG